MIDLLTIFHRGGAVLYTRSLAPVPGAPVDNLISSVLLEERTGLSSFRHEDKYTVKWAFANELDLVFVAVYLNLSNLLYMDELLSGLRDRFTAMFREAALSIESPAKFAKFSRVVEEMVAKYEKPMGGATAIAAATLAGTAPGAQAAPLMASEKKPSHAHGPKKKGQAAAAAAAAATAAGGDGQGATNEPDATSAASSGTTIGGVNMEKLLALQQASRTGKPSLNIKKKVKAAAASSSEDADASGAAAAPAKKGKVMAKSDKRVTKADLATLDYTKKIDGENAASGERPESGFDGPNRGAADAQAYKEAISAEYSSDDEPEDEVEVEDGSDDDSSSSSSSAAAPAAKKPSGGFFSYFKSLVSGKVLERSDLEPILAQFKEALNGKNVAAEISEHLAESVIKTLEGQKLASFTSVKSMVRTAVEAALTRILTPNRQIDVLQGVVEANEQKRPYSIVFVGVNGVGKSTSLAKTAHYFLSKDLTVGVGACDTFRAGAIEQLRTHTKALGIPLYARGYDRDAASVAQDAIAQARRDGLNVVLIDTAGRMQHNEPLMRALAKLITMNKPDLVLFVGEALVGNDAVDQVREFNRCLSDMSEEKKPRLIDGIILTKFDTIDDKVGAAISMAYVTGQPILFVGTGQTYPDLKRMNVKTLIRALLK